MPDEVGAARTSPPKRNRSLRAVGNDSVLVIGAGFGGIAAALRMRARGYNVTLIDRLDAIGGRAQVFERGGFRHDAGPTVNTGHVVFGGRCRARLELRYQLLTIFLEPTF